MSLSVGVLIVSDSVDREVHALSIDDGVGMDICDSIVFVMGDGVDPYLNRTLVIMYI